MKDSVIIWGIGFLFRKHKKYLCENFDIKYVYDKKIKKEQSPLFEGFEVLSYEELCGYEQYQIIMCMTDIIEMDRIRSLPIFSGRKMTRLTDIIPIDRVLSFDEVIGSNSEGGYIDQFDNRIICNSPDYLNRITFRFNGSNASVIIGENIRINKELKIECGSNCSVIIGDNTTFVNTTIYSSYADVLIGNDCMFSYGIYIRNHDSHCIFNINSGQRLNYSRNIEIGDHVWVGQNCILLGGFKVGKGSVLGAGSVSSSQFESNIIIGGNPARIIRKDVCWTRDMTWSDNFDNINEILER